MTPIENAFDAAVMLVADSVGVGRACAQELSLASTLAETVAAVLKAQPETSFDACYELHTAAAELYGRLYEEPEEGDDDAENSVATTPAPPCTPCTAQPGLSCDELVCGMKRGKELGRGAFGRVSKAIDRGGCVYAVKELVLSGTDDKDQAKAEYDVLKQLAHCNIVRVWDLQIRGDSVAEIVMSFWTQGSIAHQLAEFGALSLYTVRKYVSQLLSGLGYLHSVTVLHRDVKPANALVDAAGRVALTDFGLASMQASATSAVVGSPPYISPGILTAQGYTQGSDLWALGCSVLEMVTAKLPWSNESVVSPPANGFWEPQQFFFAIGDGAQFKTPLDGLSVEDRKGLDAELRDWLGQAFTAERDHRTHRSLIDHRFLWTPAERAKRRALARHSSNDTFGLEGVLNKGAFRAPSGPVRVFTSGPRDSFDRFLANLQSEDSAVSCASAFAGLRIRAKDPPPGYEEGFSNATVDTRRLYCCRKRPAHALAYLLGRDADRREMEADVPMLALSQPLLARSDEDTEIVIDANALDGVDEEEHRAGVCEDVVFDELMDDEPGPSAQQVYGDGAFRISVGELKRLARSVHVELTGDVPRKFFSELTAQTRGSSLRVAFWSAHRAIPLRLIGDPKETDAVRSVVEAEVSRAGGAAQSIRQQRDQLMRSSLTLRGPSPPTSPAIDDPDESWSSQRCASGFASSEYTAVDELDRQLSAVHTQLHAESFRLRRCERQAAALKNASQIGKAMQEGRFVGWFVPEKQEMQRLLSEFAEWRSHVSLFPAEYGFPSEADARAALDLSLTELCTAVCISEQGYLFVDGCNGAHRQLHARTQPVTILSAAGLDFTRPGATVREASKYFTREASVETKHKGWKGFLPLAEHRLRERLKALYAAVFSSAQRQGARNLSMLPMGLGQFLENLDEEGRAGVRRAYFEAQFELLCDRNWGFDTYYLNPGEPGHHDLAEGILRRVLEADGGRHLRCRAVVFHSCDGTFLAAELAKRSMAPALLNPSDLAAIMLGVTGTSWELGRGHTYGAEQDLCTHSTSVITRSSVAISEIALRS
eukprot:TRINITY_DN9191_c1_g1_i1.p1 TRINITY_DN9191_c1_g1~~TRINITY_DN9191_c1_g1_i1.p1  ORF type:complete len:1052 (+),score=319.97 TRINITY_DN9191_c1_g1_i1:112-3267(+)